jgi:aspartate/methionine/tyrosine aminotransferase
MPAISQRARAIAESATLAITTRANQLRAAGEPVIGFGAGEPDFPTPPHIVAAAARATGDAVNHHYGAAAGLPTLRSAIADKTARDSLLDVDPAHVVVTNGAKQAVFMAFQVLLDPGDEVLIPAPYWVTYPETVRFAGGVPIAVEAGIDLKITPEMLDAATTDRTKMLVFTSPSNPTGVVYSPAEVAAIGSWAASRDIFLVTDEIYEHLVYGEAQFSSIPAQVPEVMEKCVIINGVSKTYAMTGWRVGWLIGPGQVSAAAIKLQSHLSSNVAMVSQVAALAALEGGLESVAEMRVAFDRRRRRMFEALS